jgi:aryl carrier-like protein
MAAQLSPATVRTDIAEMLHRDPADITATEDLYESGLDSVRLLTLVERWRAAGAEVGFVDLAERPTLANWLSLLTPRVAAALDA